MRYVPRLGQKDVGLLAVLGAIVLIIAWLDGGERELRQIEEEIAVPEGAL